MTIASGSRRLADAAGVECLELDLTRPDELERLVRSLSSERWFGLSW